SHYRAGRTPPDESDRPPLSVLHIQRCDSREETPVAASDTSRKTPSPRYRAQRTAPAPPVARTVFGERSRILLRRWPAAMTTPAARRRYADVLRIPARAARRLRYRPPGREASRWYQTRAN